jgi:hypothetical protein
MNYKKLWIALAVVAGRLLCSIFRSAMVESMTCELRNIPL